jgi:hypothetical protein
VGCRLLGTLGEFLGLWSVRRGFELLGREIDGIAEIYRLERCWRMHWSSWKMLGKLDVAVMGKGFAPSCSKSQRASPVQCSVQSWESQY